MKHAPPWRLTKDRWGIMSNSGYLITIMENDACGAGCSDSQCLENAALIIKSVNEAPLLQAVADAAALVASYPNRYLPRLDAALAALAAHRNGGGE